MMRAGTLLKNEPLNLCCKVAVIFLALYATVGAALLV